MPLVRPHQYLDHYSDGRQSLVLHPDLLLPSEVGEGLEEDGVLGQDGGVGGDLGMGKTGMGKLSRIVDRMKLLKNIGPVSSERVEEEVQKPKVPGIRVAGYLIQDTPHGGHMVGLSLSYSYGQHVQHLGHVVPKQEVPGAGREEGGHLSRYLEDTWRYL